MTNKGFFLLASNKSTTIFIDTKTDDLVLWAVTGFITDVEEITGKRTKIFQTNKISDTGI